MRFLLAPVLSVLMLTLAGCEMSYSGVPALQAAPAAPQRCTHCGWIESKRELQPGASDFGAALVYEYIVRMPDGSASVFREQYPSSWREGERLIFIKGAGAID